MNRKHIIAILALALCTALGIVAASALTGGEKSPSPEPKPIAGETEEGPECSYGPPPGYRFIAHSLRTDGYHEDVEYPVWRIIRSVEELNDYYDANRDSYNMADFAAACQGYDEAYFQHRILVIVVVEAGSGSVRYEVTGVEPDGDTLGVGIDVQVPTVGTCDMAQWHILIEPDEGVDADRVEVELHLTGQELPHGLAYAAADGVSAALHIPEGWTFEIDRLLAPDCEYEFAIAFKPLERTNWIVLRRTSFMGVCGTGLTQETICLGDCEGRKGTYDGRKQWEFITIRDDEGTSGFFISNETMEEWSDREYREAMNILETLEIGEGRPTEAQAIEIAKSVVTVDYDYAKALYHEEDGAWTVAFGRRNVAGGDQLVTVNDAGEIVDTAWGEWWEDLPIALPEYEFFYE